MPDIGDSGSKIANKTDMPLTQTLIEPCSIRTAFGGGHMSKQRDIRIDFFRGLALIMIFIDHVQGNFLSHFTIKNIGPSTAAQIFIFISGYIYGIVYQPIYVSRGFYGALLKSLRRFFQIYLAHIVVGIVIVSAALYFYRTNAKMLHFFVLGQVGTVLLSDPITTTHDLTKLLWEILTCKFLVEDILPFYMIVLVFAPFFLFLINSVGRMWAILVCFALYLIPQINISVNLYEIHDIPWYFNPFAWQFLFFIGVVFGISKEKFRFHRWSSASICIALLIILLGGVFKIVDGAEHWILGFDGVWRVLSQSRLGILNLIHFFSVALIATKKK